MTVTTASFQTDQRYGSIQNDEDSDDEILKESIETNDDDENDEEDENENVKENELNSKVFSEVELAAKSRADTTIIRATEHENQGPPNDTIITNSSNGSDPKTTKEDVNESMSEQTLNDAAEFESLLFSIRRTSARSRLLKFISTLKRLSAKFQREEEVKEVLQQINGNHNTTSSNNCNATTINSEINPSKRSNNSKSDEATEPSTKRIKREENSSQTPIFADTALTNASLLRITNGCKIASKTTTTMTATVPRSNPPLLKEKDEWVKLHQTASTLICPDYTVNNSCPLGNNCPRKHVYKPPIDKPNLTPMTKDLYNARKLRLPSVANTLGWYSRIDLERVYDTYRKTILTKDSFSDKIKPDELNVSYYTSCFTCPVDKTVYYSQPFPGDLFVNGNKSSQGIWWYLNIKDARDAVVTHVIRHLQERKIVPLDFKPDMRSEEEVKMMKKKNAVKAANVLAQSSSLASSTSIVTKPTTKTILPSVLPNISPWNWAELDYESRCTLFNTPQGCTLGYHCKFAHVHYPQNVITDRFPPKQALPLAYNQHFNIFIEDAFFQPMHQRHASTVFHVKTIVDSHNQIWYTAAWICPHEKTIYYAAGGTSGRSNPQGFVVYPSVEEAKLAVCGIVLNAFFARGLRGAWSQGYLS